MTGEFLVDSNLLVYAYDRAEPAKQPVALDILRRLETNGRGTLSTQVLGEFFRVVTQKIQDPLDPTDAYDQLSALTRTWPVLPITTIVVIEAARGVRDHRLSYWDAQLWATARLNQIPVVLSEDFTSGSALEGVRFLNPLTASFDRAMLG